MARFSKATLKENSITVAKNFAILGKGGEDVSGDGRKINWQPTI
jgi:hypothetical protein